jgi:hypothetical protein
MRRLTTKMVDSIHDIIGEKGRQLDHLFLLFLGKISQ